MERCALWRTLVFAKVGREGLPHQHHIKCKPRSEQCEYDDLCENQTTVTPLLPSSDVDEVNDREVDQEQVEDCCEKSKQPNGVGSTVWLDVEFTHFLSFIKLLLNTRSEHT